MNLVPRSMNLPAHSIKLPDGEPNSASQGRRARVKLILVPFVLCLLLGSQAMTTLSQNAQEPQPLEPGHPVEREISSGQTHAYSLMLSARQFLHIVVEQRGIDVVVSLFGPDGRKLFEGDSPNGTRGPEPLIWITEAPGAYRLEVKPLGAAVASGRYQARVEALREATEQDAKLISADRLLRDGVRLRLMNTRESYQEAVKKFEEALSLYKNLPDRAAEGITLSNLGALYAALGDVQKGREFGEQSLSLSRTAGDRVTEATTLQYLANLHAVAGDKQKALDAYGQARRLFQAIGDRANEAYTLILIGRLQFWNRELQQALQSYTEALASAREARNPVAEATALVDLGGVYSGLNERQKMLDSYLQASQLFNSAGERAGEAFALNSLGNAYLALNDLPKARDYNSQSLRLYQLLNNQAAQAAVLNTLGVIYLQSGEKEKARDSHQQALDIYRALNDKPGQALSQQNVANIYKALGQKEKAIEQYEQALELRRGLNDRSGEAFVIASIGVIYAESGERQKAEESYRKSLGIYRDLHDRNGEAGMLRNLGILYDEADENEQALKFYNEALPIFRDLKDRVAEAAILYSVGTIYAEMSQPREALKYLEQQAQIMRDLNNQQGEAVTRNDIGMLYIMLGEAQLALDSHTRALELMKAVGNRAGEADILIALGNDYNSLNQRERAIELYQQALQLKRESKDKEGEAQALLALSISYGVLGDIRKALEIHQQALPLIRSLNDRTAEAGELFSMGLLYLSNNEYRKGLDVLQQALKLVQESKDRRIEAYLLTFIGITYYLLDDNQRSLETLNQALPLTQAAGLKNYEAITLGAIGTLERDSGKLDAARAHIKQGLDIVESLRTKVLNQELRLSLFSSMRDYYDAYIQVLMRLHQKEPAAGHDREALEISEKGRARTLLETLAEADADIQQGADPNLLERERALKRQLNAEAEAQVRLLSGTYTKERADAIARTIQALTTELQQVETRIKQTSPRYAALTQPQPLSAREIQTELLDADTLLLEYALGDDHSYLWVVSNDAVKSYELPEQKEIEAAAREFYGLLNARNLTVEGETEEQTDKRIAQADSQLAAASARLSRMALGPTAGQLAQKRLLIVSDGALQYIPFAALTDPQTFNEPHPAPLVVQHEIVNLPSASTLAVLRKEVQGRTPAPKTIAILADPVFDNEDPRVPRRAAAAQPAGRSPQRRRRELPRGLEQSATEASIRGAGLEIKRLPGTRYEADQILKLVPAAEAKGAFDFAASRETARSPELSQYRYVHFATHGYLNSLHPEMSGIVLSLVNEQGQPADGFLLAHEIFNLKLPAELVVLSACQTGLGKEVRGEGLVGLTRGFMYAGSPRVVVSLWSVNDEATAELMARFYRGMLGQKLRPAAALRAAQISLMKERDWESPFYWAAFTLQGEWR